MFLWIRRYKTCFIHVSKGKLGLHEVINKACVVDRAGETVLEFLLLLTEQDLAIMGSQKARELIAVTTLVFMVG